MRQPDGNLIIKQIKAVFSHSHLRMSSRFSTKTPLDLSARGEHLQKQSLKMFFQDLDTSVKYRKNRKGERLEHLIWFTCVGQGDYTLFSIALHHIVTSKVLDQLWNCPNYFVTKIMWPMP